MNTHRLISVISDDKPGIIEAIADTIAEHQGSWLESRLSKLAGKFAGVIRVAVAEAQVSALDAALQALSQRGIWIHSDALSEGPDPESGRKAYVHLVGPDRPGIVRELSKALVRQRINVANLETTLSSTPYSGEPLFEATGALEVPAEADLHALEDTLHAIGDALALDISLSETPFD